MFKPLSQTSAAPRQRFALLLGGALFLAALMIGASAIFSDLFFGTIWITGALLGGGLVILGSLWISAKLSRPTTQATASESVAVPPFGFTAYGPALKSNPHCSPSEAMPLVKKEESRLYETC
jgi:disulfide bond formation protein DsbB